MSHALNKVNIGNNAVVVCTILNYVQGGESFTLAELGLTGSLIDIIFLFSDAQSCGQMFPVLSGGTVTMRTCKEIASPEIPSTNNLNYTFVAIVVGSGTN
jgi:hypothetical protein